jgi:acyl carrier protein
VRKTTIAIFGTQSDISPDKILVDTAIKEDLGAGYLNVMTFTMTIENRFRVPLYEEAAREPYTANIFIHKLVDRIGRIRAQSVAGQ